MPWGKNKSYNFKESDNKQKNSVQTTSYEKKEQYCKDCPCKPKQISTYEESKTGKLSRILSGL